MGIFNFWQKKTADLNGHAVSPESDLAATTSTKPSPAEAGQDNIHALFNFLSKDYQQQGFDDALVNPDTSYMNQNLEAIQGDLQMVVRRVKVYYTDSIQQLEFLMESRRRMGMIDIVDELKMKLEKAKSHQEQVQVMEKEAHEGLGATQRVIISYKRGFTNGLAAIAYQQMNNINF